MVLHVKLQAAWAPAVRWQACRQARQELDGLSSVSKVSKVLFPKNSKLITIVAIGIEGSALVVLYLRADWQAHV